MAADIVATDDESQSAQLFGKELVRKMVVPVTFAVLAYAALLLYGDSRAVLSTLNGLPALAFATGIMISLDKVALIQDVAAVDIAPHSRADIVVDMIGTKNDIGA